LRPRQEKICTADEAVALVVDDATVASGGFVGAAHPEALTAALERRFLAAGKPQGLTLIYAAGQGDGKSRGLNHLAHPGLLRRVIGGHWGLCPRLGELAMANQIEAYNFPQGVICHLFRDIAAHRPGCITHVGLGTFADPAHGGGRVNSRTTEHLVERIELGGAIWLWYKSMAIDVALVRATAADANGGLLMDDEPIVGEILAIVQAVKNSGGVVIAQVARLLDQCASPHAVRVPGMLVDRLVLAAGDEHDQTFAERMNPSYCQSQHHQNKAVPRVPFPVPNRMPLDERRIIACRVCDEISEGSVVNLGIGMPEGVAQIAAERGLLERCTLTVESGAIGGRPANGLSFGASAYPHAIVDQPAQFDFYDGGGLDFAALGAAQIDAAGNVNVSQFRGRFVGVGGFINIAQNARQVVFCCTMTADGLKIDVQGGRLRVLRDGVVHKFVNKVDQLSFSAHTARANGQRVLYVTERAVFKLGANGLELMEIAPGVDCEADVIGKMDFKPSFQRQISTMSSMCFAAP
jgi:propionate CoA-transferase